MATAARASRLSRLFVMAGLVWFVAWQLAVVAGVGRGLSVTLGLYGFVLHTVFGKAYALLPSYFDRQLATTWLPAGHFPLALAGTAGLAVAATGDAPAVLVPASAAAWALGCLAFVATIVWTIRDNPTGAETGTSDANADRRRVDRYANAFVPVVLAYLLVAAGLAAAGSIALDTGPLPRSGPPVTHLFAAGTAALLVFAVGFRLLPRFLVVHPRVPLVAVVLPAGALAPAALALTFGAGSAFLAAAALEAVALLGYAVAVLDMYRRSDRRRVGLATVAVAAVGAAVVALLGLHMAATGITPALAAAHVRVALLGFLGLTVVGVTYQFYPPAVASLPAIGDRAAAVAVASLAAGLGLEVLGHLVGHGGALAAGRWLVLAGAVLHLLIVAAVLRERRRRT